MTNQYSPKAATKHVANQFKIDAIIEQRTEKEVIRRMPEFTQPEHILMHDEFKDGSISLDVMRFFE